MVSLTFFLAAVAGMLLSFSRACWLNFGVAVVIFFAAQLVFATPGAWPRLRTGAIVVIAGAISVFWLSDTAAVSQMLKLRVTSNGFQRYDEARFATQTLAWETAQKRPLGIGPGQAEMVFGYATHNMYMRVLSENGWVALIALLVFLGATVARACSVIRNTRDEWIREVNLVALACIVGHLANSLVIDTVHWRHIWFVYALPWVYLPVPEFSRRLRLKRRPTFEREAGYATLAES